MNISIGDRVKVIKLTDETADQRFLNQLGIVIGLDYDCGCGQSYPNDPMILIQFENGTEEYWIEEIKLIHKYMQQSI